MKEDDASPEISRSNRTISLDRSVPGNIIYLNRGLFQVISFEATLKTFLARGDMRLIYTYIDQSLER